MHLHRQPREPVRLLSFKLRNLGSLRVASLSTEAIRQDLLLGSETLTVPSFKALRLGL
jgi:hypothetical protein